MSKKTPVKAVRSHLFNGKNGKIAKRDVAKFGLDTAIYNHGFLDGWDDGNAKGYLRGFERAMLLIMGNGIKWTNAERRLGNRITRKLFGKKR